MVKGAACQPGQGVTVAVDYSLDGSNVEVRCAVASGSEPAAFETIQAAFEAARFEMVNAPSGMVTGVEGFIPTSSYGEQAWWFLQTSTVDGLASGEPSDVWVGSPKGAGDGPVKVGQAYMLRAIGSWSCPDQSGLPTEACPGSLPLDAIIDQSGNQSVPPAAVTPGTPNAQAAAAWIATQLAANDDVAIVGDAIDWGLTIDALIGMASAGVAGDQIAATADRVWTSGDAWIGAPDQVSARWQRVAKVALGLQVAGLDPAVFPYGDTTRDLISELRSVITPEGTFGAPATDDVFNHSVAMTVLGRTDGGAPESTARWLVSQQCHSKDPATNYSFGWAPDCSAPDLDATAWAAQAVPLGGINTVGPTAGLAQEWMMGQQDASGGFLTWGSVNTNSTGLALQTFGDWAMTAEQTAAGQSFIGGLQVTWDTVDANPALTEAAVGAIAYTAAGFETLKTQGLAEGTGSSEFRATTQAILGLGAEKFLRITAVGADPATPDRTRPVTDPPVVDPPAADPGAKAPTGGTVTTDVAPMLLAGFALLAMGAVIARRVGSRA